VRKILLCLEDYNELLFVETLLKKLGFTVDVARNEQLLPDQLLSTLPELVVATGKGHKINGARIGKKVKHKGLRAKLLLLFPRGKIPHKQELSEMGADGAVETPLNPRRFIMAICEITGLESELVIAKFDKLPIGKGQAGNGENIQVIHGEVPLKKTDSKSRTEKYNALLKDVPPSKQELFSKKKIQDEVTDIRRQEKESDPRELSELEKGRNAFVVALFKKK
jgi:DNA-binding response OmpR family regulator